jgi:hypothetical protein
MSSRDFYAYRCIGKVYEIQGVTKKLGLEKPRVDDVVNRVNCRDKPISGALDAPLARKTRASAGSQKIFPGQRFNRHGKLEIPSDRNAVVMILGKMTLQMYNLSFF